MFKIVSQLDPAGYFVGPTSADADPKTPGEFLLPFGCVDVAPPNVPAGKRAIFFGGEFVLEDAPSPQEPEEPLPPTQAEVIAATRIKAKTTLLQILPLLDSLQVDALTDGSTVVWQGETTPLAEVIKQLKAGLRSVVGMDLSAYETAEEMEDAIQAAYFSLAMQAPDQVKSAFSAFVPK